MTRREAWLSGKRISPFRFLWAEITVYYQEGGGWFLDCSRNSVPGTLFLEHCSRKQDYRLWASWSPYDGPKSFLLGRSISLQRTWSPCTVNGPSSLNCNGPEVLTAGKGWVHPTLKNLKELLTGALSLSMDQVHHIAKGLKYFLLWEDWVHPTSKNLKELYVD